MLRLPQSVLSKPCRSPHMGDVMHPEARSGQRFEAAHPPLSYGGIIWIQDRESNPSRSFTKTELCH
jgi:hypothetical protein